MAKAVLISIRPEWVSRILCGEKTVEVRKSRPRLEAPFKCYIYCTKGRKPWVLDGGQRRGQSADVRNMGQFAGGGKTNGGSNERP